MNQSQNIITWLRQLTQLEADVSRVTKNKGALGEIPQQISTLRNLLPTSILSHHDALKSRGRRSVAAVRNGVCGGCHLGVPRGTILELLRTQNELTVCNNCGVFIFLSDEDHQKHTEGAASKGAPAKKKAGRKPAAASV